MKLLIVEDEPSLREIMVRTLRGERYVVEEAADYASALAKLEDYDYDCILLDIMLPGGSGLRLLERLKELRKSAGVIIISARDSLDDKVEGLELGADDYLAKPFHLAELSARIRSVIRRHQRDGQHQTGQKQGAEEQYLGKDAIQNGVSCAQTFEHESASCVT